MEITLDQLKNITNQKESILLSYVEPLNQLFAQDVSFSNLIISHFLSQVLHESACFRYTKELSSGEQYEGRKDLGNTQPGFGKRFLGRGAIQITGFFNYQKLSDYFKVDFISKPELLETPEWAIKSAKWFWDTKGLSSLANQNDFLGIVFKVNGGFTNLKDRLKYLKLCLKTFNVPDIEMYIRSIFSRIEQNISLPKSNYYKVSLAKQVPDIQSLSDLKNFVNLL